MEVTDKSDVEAIQTDKPFPPDPCYNLYLYPVIPNNVIKKFLRLLEPATERWIDRNSYTYNLLKNFTSSFSMAVLDALVDSPTGKQFYFTLQSNSAYAEQSMAFLEATPIARLYGWLSANRFEGPPPELRADYKSGSFAEEAQTIFGTDFDQYLNLYGRLEYFVNNYNEVVVDDFLHLTRAILCLPI